ncbi:MAG: CRISPR-associated helicase Cas3' [Rhodocyclales bacterium]|nr:CRISPR-associated helicase Cas3' [Rhodocyclales bacterium]
MTNEINTEYIAHVRKNGDRQCLRDHLRGVGGKASTNAAKIGLGTQGELIGLLHDLGKYSAAFQAYLGSATDILNQDEDEEFVDAGRLRGKIDHSTAGAQLVWRELEKRGPLGQIAGQMLALCIASHHSGLIDCLSSDHRSLGDDVFTRRMQKADERSHLVEAWRKADVAIRERVESLLAKPKVVAELQTWLGRIVLAAPNKTDQGFVAQQQIGLLVRFLFSCLIDADRLDTAIFEKPRANRHRPQGDYVDWSILINRLETHLAALEPREPIDRLRQDISQHCLAGAARERGIFTLSVPTGGGKTLASLRFALHHAARHTNPEQSKKIDRIIYVIPFTSIIDQNAEVVRGILEPKGDPAEQGRIVLEHHSNLTPEVQGWRDKILTENWDAPVIYTTMVQFLEALFGAGTRGARRMHQLANAVLIFDEVQSLPVNCVHLFNNAINFLADHCGSTVVLCTATQPLLDKVDPSQGAIRLRPNSELMPDVRVLFADLKRVEVINQHKPGGWTQEEVATLAREETQDDGSCLVIVNTKKAAQVVYLLCQADSSIPVFHLSTSLCPAHRKAILREVRQSLERREPVLCVSTQLIEAGVDVDFGAVIRYTAGLDSIAQAAGRCNRNGRNATGRVHVINPRDQDENLDKLIDIRIGRDKTARILDDYEANPARFNRNLIGPEAMAWYYENYFFARKADMSYPVSRDAIGHDDSLLNLLSSNSLASAEYGQRNGEMPKLYLRQSFKSAAQAFKAIDAPTQGVIVPYGESGRELVNDLCAAFEVEKQYALLRLAQQYTVNVFPHQLAKLQEEGAVHPVQEGTEILHLDPRYYSEKFGLVTEPVNSMEVLDA